MRTQIAYVLTSDDSDSYYEQLLISVFSLRKHNDKVQIIVVCDKDTEKSLVGKRAKIRERVDSIVVVEIPAAYNKLQKSRFLKTNLRNIINGDYLYIDTDTVICDSIEKIDELVCEIGAVKEYNRHSVFSEEDKWAYGLAEKAGLECELLECPYFNSGVMFVRDTKNSHDLYTNWHHCWKDYLKKGLSTDQTALCYANKLCGFRIQHIDDIWNCQVAEFEGMKIAKTAKIIHYYHGLGDISYPLSLDSIYQTVRLYGDIPPIVEYLVENSRLMLSNYENYTTITSTRVDFQSPASILYGRINTKQSIQIILYNLKKRIIRLFCQS